MVITLVSDTFLQNNNGTSISANRFAKQLAKRGHTVRVVTCGDPNSSGFDEKTGLHMYYVQELWLPIVTHFAHKQNTLIAKPAKDVLREAIADSDAVHIYQAWPLGGAARSIAKKLDVPCVAAFHIQPENITWNLGLRRFRPAVHLTYLLMRIFFYRRFNHIHCPSHMIAAQLRKRGYKAWLHVISNGVHPDFHPEPHIKKFSDGKFHILSVGRLSPEKRQDVLLKAVKLSKYSEKIQVHIAGNGPLRAKLQGLGEELVNPPKFCYFKQGELIDMMRKCHLYVHASDIEIEGLGCTEAFSCGLVPVISASKLSATGQFALDERSLFAAGNSEELARRIDYWFENPEEIAAASAAYAELGRTYSLEESVREMERVYSGADLRGDCFYQRGAAFRFFSRVCTAYIAIPLLFLWTRFALGVRVEGRAKLRGAKGAVAICNHVHLLDGALVGIALFPNKMVIPTLLSNLRGIFPGVLVNLFGGAPIADNPADLKPFFDEMRMRLLSGENVLFFPEGHLVPYEKTLREFKKGAFHLAAKARVPLIPIAISFVPPSGIYRLFRKKPVMRLKICDPIEPVDIDPKRDTKKRMEFARRQMEDAIAR